ncbi:hypothetical protein [Oryza sativa Japonica Group]|uniref:Uncharacterized protein n=1 Tax=Oryza sativa subsp. japonica TaxID=39947 RepID=Q5VQV5_ORYSJ|nr:hypothetical protein [Oryza sativa Japonica Group]
MPPIPYGRRCCPPPLPCPSPATAAVAVLVYKGQLQGTNRACRDMEGVPYKEGQPEFYMESTRTARIGSSTVSDFVGRELEEEGYPVVDYESDLQTAMSTTVR